MSQWRCKSIVWSSGAVQAGDLGGMIFKAVRLNKIIYGDKRAENQALRPPMFRGQEVKRNHERIQRKRNQGGMRKTRSTRCVRFQVKKVFNSKSCTVPAYL